MYNSKQLKMRLMDPSNRNPKAVIVYAKMNLGTNFAVSIHTDATVQQLISKLEVEHYSCFCKFGRIKIPGLQVERDSQLYHLSPSVPLKLFFKGCNAWFVHVDAFQISAREPSNKPETSSHETTEKKDQEKTPNYKSRKFELGNRVVKAAECLHPCPQTLKLSQILLMSENRYTNLMVRAFSYINETGV